MKAGPSFLMPRGSIEKAIPHTRISDDNMIKDSYEVGPLIGKGSFGKVNEAKHKGTGSIWAMKSINKEKAGSHALTLVEREVAILKLVNHPNIIDLNEVIESPKRMYLVMELCTGGELADVLNEKKMFSEAETKIIITRLASAISYLHKHGIVHRDLKLENILMNQNPDDPDDKFHVKVTDFGLSVVKGAVTPDRMMQDFCGTPIYMAPEIFDNKSYSQQCDVWALGVITYTLLCGHAPFYAKDENALSTLIREGHVKFDDEVWNGISEACKNCIQGMLKVDPAHRLSAAEVLNHPWLTGEECDTKQPANVLEMMKMWKSELLSDSAETATPNMSTTDSVTLPMPSLESTPACTAKKPDKKCIAWVAPIGESRTCNVCRKLSIDASTGAVKKLSPIHHPSTSKSMSAKATPGKKAPKVSVSSSRSPTVGRKQCSAGSVSKSPAASLSSPKRASRSPETPSTADKTKK